MLGRLRSAYGAGWRAGMVGTSYRDCPLSGLRRHFWLAGWDIGIEQGVTRWLNNHA